MESLQAHVNQRVNTLYPKEVYTDDAGAIPPALRTMVSSQATCDESRTSESAYEMKQATMPDAADEAESIYIRATNPCGR